MNESFSEVKQEVHGNVIGCRTKHLRTRN